MIAAAHATVGADDGKTAELLRTLNAMHSDAQTAGGAAAINVLGTDVGEEVRAQLFHLVGLHVLFYAPARRCVSYVVGFVFVVVVVLFPQLNDTR